MVWPRLPRRVGAVAPQALIAPGGEHFRAGDVLSLVILRQQLTAQRREIEQLRVRLAVAEQGLNHLAPAANEARRA